MAELDDKLLKNLDKTLENMSTHLQNLETELKGVKNGLESTFNTAILKSFSEELRGIKAARLINAEDNVSEVNKIYSAIQEFDRRVKTGKKLELISDEQVEKYKQELNEIEKQLDAVANKRLKGQEWLDRRALYERRNMLRDLLTSDQPMVAVPLSKKELEEAVELLKKYKELYAGITKGEQQRAVELANIYAKERKADMKSADDALAQTEQEERKKFEIERAWNEKSTKEAEQRDKQKLATEKATADERLAIIDAEAKKRAEMEQGWAEIERQRQEREAKAAKEMAQMGDIAATPNKTGNLAELKEIEKEHVKLQKQREDDEKKLAEIRRGNTQARLQDEQHAEKMIAEERARRAKEAEDAAKQRFKEAQESNKAWTQAANAEQKAQAKMRGAESKQAYREQTEAIKQQIVYQKQLMALRKEYIALNQKKDRTDKESADLERIKTKIKEIINLSKQLNKEQVGTHNIAFKATEYERFRQSIKGATKATKEHNAELNKMLPTLQRLASAFGVAFSVRSLAQFGKKLIETRSEFELQQVALRSILQNKQLADEIWDKTLRAALQSPYTAMQLTKYTQQLAAYRIETAKLFDTTKRLADVSAGLGVDMQRLILAYGQVKAANYLRASEIRQFTEAGVNILGELSQYFTETREGMYSTAQVMDMVQKRMVKFEDVAEIFKRMTDQGGIFYNMQYIQSQTVKGQMMKLKDAFDQMLNSIGKGNEGVIKNLIAAMNNMVQNWRTWAVVLKSIGWAAALGYMSKFVFQLNGITQASTATLKSFAKLKKGLQDLGKALRANWLSLVVAGVTALLTAMVSLNKRMKEVNREIDEQNLRLYETRQNFRDMKSKIEANNTVLKQQSANTKSLNKAQKENESIMQKLRNEYPQLAEQMSIATNGIIDMNGALDANIRKLNEQMTILNAMKQGNWIVDSDQKNLTDWQSALATMRTTLLAAQSEARRQVLNMELREGGTEDPLYAKLKEFADKELPKDILKAVEAFKKLNGEVLAYQANLFMGTPTRPESLYSMLGIKVGNLQANWSYNRVTEVLDKFAPALQSFYENGIKDNADFLKTINEQYGGDVTQFIKENAEKINKATIDGLNTANDVLINTLKPQTEEMRIFLNQELNKRFGTSGIDFFSKSTKDTNTEADEDKQNKIDSAWRRRINLLEEMKKRYDELSKSAYGYAKSESKVRTAFDDSFKEIFKGTGISMSQIDFTSMQGMFDSMRLALSKASGISDAVREEIMKKIDSYEARIEIDAQVRVREDFGKQMEKMFSDYELTLDFESIGLPSDLAKNLFGVDTSSLDEISSYLQKFATEHAEDWNDEINKVYTDSLKKIGDKEQEMFKKSISNLFKRVKNSADEMKTVMAQAAADINFADMLFDKQEAQKNIDTITEQIEKNIEEINRLTPADGKATGVAAQQIARLEAENKILQNRVLRLSQMYGNLSAEQYTDLVRATMEHENEQLQKISLEQLKQLPEYIEAMGRTAGWSNEKLREMLDYLQNLISVSGGNIDITEYKSIINQIDKIQAEIKHNDYPFGREGFAKVAQMLQEQAEAEAKLNELTEERNQLVSEQKLLELEEIELQARLNELKAKGLDENSTEIQEIMDDIKSNQKFKTSNLNAQKKNAAGIQTITKGNAQTMAIIDAIIHGINNLVQEIYQNLKKVEILLQDYEVDTEHGKWAKWSKGMETFAKASQDATNGWEAYKKGDIAGIVYEVINGITDIWHGINEMVSQKHVDTIYEMEQELERLTVDYEKLQKAIEKTWDTSSYMMNYDKMVKNLEDQRKALQAQYDAEDARKNSDEEKMKEYQNSIRDIDETLTELKQKQIEVFGGLGEVNYRSAAQEFVDSWKEAFLETGDGLQGLQDHFDEFLNEWFVKQATMRIAGRMLAPLFEDIDKAVDESSLGGTSVLLSELQRVREKFATIAPQLSDSLEQLAGMWGLGEGEGGLSGLAAGIQGMTEEQANILEAYWNSVRGYTASIDMNVSRIADMLGAGSADLSNPMLQSLRNIEVNTAYIRSIYDLLDGTTRNLGQGRGFISYQM